MFQTGSMPRPQFRERPRTPIVPIARVRHVAVEKARTPAGPADAVPANIPGPLKPADPPKTGERDIWFLQSLEFLPAPRRAKMIKAHAAKAHGLTVEDLEGPRRTSAVVRARWEAIAAIAKANPSWSLPQIGRCFNKDHTTVLNALREMGVRP